MADADNGRPPQEDRLHSDRSEPAVIAIRTRFDYDHTAAQAGRPPRVTRYHSQITNAGEFGSHAPQYVGDVLTRMVASFGDDADLEVVIRRIVSST